MTTLELKNICKQFGNKYVLDDITFAAHKGQCIGVIGSNGAGKSTLLSVIINTLVPEKGRLFIDNRELNKTFDLTLKRQLGAIVNRPHLVEQLSIQEFLEYIARIYNILNYNERIDSLMKYLMGDYQVVKHRPIRLLSTGMKQKVAFASTILHKPGLLVLDEPLNGIDASSAQKNY